MPSGTPRHEEMRAFMDVNILMGIHQKPQTSMYWSTVPFLANSGIQSVFPHERFEALSRYLHLNNSQVQPERRQPNYDALYKLRPLISIYKAAFLDRLIRWLDLSVDEAMVKHKGSTVDDKGQPLPLLSQWCNGSTI